MKKFMIFGLISLTLFIFSCSEEPAAVEGCTDSSAQNYNAEATKDDGSCTYASGGGNSGGTGNTGGTIKATASVIKGNGGGTTSAEVSWNSWCDNYYKIEAIEGGSVIKSGSVIKQGDSFFYIPIDKGTTKTLSIQVTYSSGSDTETGTNDCAGRDPIILGPFTVEREDEINVKIGR